MKIVVNALSARRGGIITYTRNLMRSFRERGVDAVFALPTDSELDEDVETIRFPVAGMSPIYRALWEQIVWRKIVRKHEPDILYSSANFGLLRPPVPQVLLVREGGLFDPFYLGHVAPSIGVRLIFERILRRRLILASARSSDLVLTPTGAMRDLLMLWGGDLADSTQTNLYGTPLSHFQNTNPPRRWREDGVLRLLMVSAYYSHKQPGMIAEAVRLLNEAGLRAHFTLTMDLDQIRNTAGSAKDAFHLEQAVARGDITMLGNVEYDRLPELYGSHDIFVTPSLSETFGHPMVEAMASELVIAASDTPVHREVCRDAAAYFEPISTVSLVNLVKDLDSSPDRRAQMIENARKRGNDHYSWDGHVDRLLGYFEQVVGQTKG